jgi:hypothetical protein
MATLNAANPAETATNLASPPAELNDELRIPLANHFPPLSEQQ